MSWHRNQWLGAAAGVVGGLMIPGVGAALGLGGGVGSSAAAAAAAEGGIGAAGATGGGMLGGITASQAGLGAAGLGFLGQQQTNAANAQQAQQQMNFQASMSNTAYQRGVKDMEAAGLNPMLAYSQGGASTPGGAQATMGNSAQSAMQGAQLVTQLQNTEAQTGLIKAQAAKTTQETIDGGTFSAQQAEILRRLMSDAGLAELKYGAEKGATVNGKPPAPGMAADVKVREEAAKQAEMQTARDRLYKLIPDLLNSQPGGVTGTAKRAWDSLQSLGSSIGGSLYDMTSDPNKFRLRPIFGK